MHKADSYTKAINFIRRKMMQSNRIVTYGGISFVVVAAAVLFIFFHRSEQNKVAPVAHTVNGLASGMIVRPIHGQFMAACRSPQLLTELIAHQRAHQKAEFEDMFNAEFSCAMIPETDTFRILAVSNEMVEVVVSASPATEGGMWGPAKTFEPAE
jgi:hypothetical protein